MRRREFITLLGGAAAWPIAAYAQQGERMRRASVLMSYVESDTGAQKWAKAFADSLQELGWNNGRNIQLDYRWAGPNPDRREAMQRNWCVWVQMYCWPVQRLL